MAEREIITQEGDEIFMFGDRENSISRTRLREVIESARNNEIDFSLAEVGAMQKGSGSDLQSRLGIADSERVPVASYFRLRLNAWLAQFAGDPKKLEQLKQELKKVESD
jgi:hypothetical protein